jgi:hypothetical protein
LGSKFMEELIKKQNDGHASDDIPNDISNNSSNDTQICPKHNHTHHNNEN